VRNTTASCDSLGIHYEVSKEYGIISVNRWEGGDLERSVPAGDIQYLFFHQDMIRLPGESEWKVMGEFLRKSRNPFSSYVTILFFVSLVVHVSLTLSLKCENLHWKQWARV
jgi:hypothetical protein